MSMTAKFRGVATLGERLPLVKIHDSSNMWSLEVTRQNKNMISPMPQYLCPTSLAEWEHTVRSSLPYVHMVL